MITKSLSAIRRGPRCHRMTIKSLPTWRGCKVLFIQLVPHSSHIHSAHKRSLSYHIVHITSYIIYNAINQEIPSPSKANAIKNHNHIFMVILIIPCHNQSKLNIIILYASTNSKALNINHSSLITHVTYAHVIAHIQSQFLCSYSNMLNAILDIFSWNFRDANTNQIEALKQLSNNNFMKIL